jgi:virginiamycin B lyase
MRRLNRILGVVVLASLGGPFAHGATVTGTVKGPDGAPFKGAFVQAQNAKTRITADVLSDREGRYQVENLPAGEYDLRIRAVGYRAEPRSGVSLTAAQHASFDWALQKGIVHWSDLSLYQSKKLLPEASGKQVLFAKCFVCHGIQTRMAAVVRDESGWRDKVNYMRDAMAFELSRRFTDQDENDVVAYLTSVFGPESILPRSPAELPEYKELVRNFSDDAMKIAYVEYEMPGPNRMPWGPAPDKDGFIWMPYYGRGNKIAMLDPKTAAVEEFPVPEQVTAGVHSAFPAPDGTVWFTEFALNKIGKWDPRTKEMTEYQDTGDVPNERPSKHTIRLDRQGKVWITGSPLTRFDPETGKFFHFNEVPSSYGIAFDKEGNVWFAVLKPDGNIGRVDTKTLKVSQWAPPTKGMPQRIQVDSRGFVWFTERRGGKLGRFDPKTETFKEYELPGADPSPYALGIDASGAIWYASTDLDTIGRLDPDTGKVVEYPFPYSENMSREFFLDAQGRMWFNSPTNNKVGYFYLTGGPARASQSADERSSGQAHEAVSSYRP